MVNILKLVIDEDTTKKYAICTDEEVLDGNKFCFSCSQFCPFYKLVTKEEYDIFWNNYDNE